MSDPSASPETDIAGQARAILERLRPVVDAGLDRWLPPVEDSPRSIHESMRYSVLAPGKRLRPALALLVGEAIGASRALVLPSACALEMVHAFSLVHDDLPAMDDDDLRRGRPTNHVAFGEATAILAGDALACLAFELIARETPEPAVAAPLISELGRALGTGGMIGGQVLDMEGEQKAPDLDLVKDIHRRKTAALLAASCAMPAIAAARPEEEVRAFRTFGESVGLAFQVVDDLLDRTASPETMGKATGKDDLAGKQTWPAAAGLAAAEEAARTLTEEAVAAIRPYDRSGDLTVIARFMVSRQN